MDAHGERLMTFRPRTRRLAALAIATVAAVYASGAAGQWAWKEDSGRIVYSDRPPPAERQVHANPPTAVACRTDTSAGAPGCSARRRRRRTETGRRPPPPPVRPSRSPSATWNSASASRSAPTANARRRKSSRSRRRRRAECERARGYLRSLDDGVRISRTDASGNREYLDDAQRAAEMRTHPQGDPAALQLSSGEPLRSARSAGA